MDTIGKCVLRGLWLLNHIGTPLVDKSIDDSSLKYASIFFLVPRSWVLVHDIGDVEQAGTTINTVLIAFGALLGTTIPATAVALMIDHLVDMLLRFLAQYLRNFIASNDGRSNSQ